MGAREEQAAVFRRQAADFALLGSPVYAALAEQLADDPEPAHAILGEDASWDAAMRLFAALHHLVLTRVAPEALSGDADDLVAALAAHGDALRRFVAEQGIQTNEVARCAGLLPCFLTVARDTGLPLELVELGPSAGLNLLFDRYRYVYREGDWGPAGSHVVLRPRELGSVPAALLDMQLDVRSRCGIDLAPVDAASEDGYLLLRSFLWPGREARVDLLDAAVATLRATPERPTMLRGDYVATLPHVLAARAADAITVVFQTASTAYLTADASQSLDDVLESAGADGRPLAWISTRRRDQRETEREDSWELELRIWPDPVRLVAHLDYHGSWLDWLDPLR